MWGTEACVPYVGAALLGRTIYPSLYSVQWITTQLGHVVRIWGSLGGLVKTASQTVTASASPDNVENPQLPSRQQLKEEKKTSQNIVACLQWAMSWRSFHSDPSQSTSTSSIGFWCELHRKCSHCKVTPCFYIRFRPILSSHKKIKLSFMTPLSAWCKVQLKFILERPSTPTSFPALAHSWPRLQTSQLGSSLIPCCNATGPYF